MYKDVVTSLFLSISIDSLQHPLVSICIFTPFSLFSPHIIMANLDDIVPAGASTQDYLALVNAWSPEERIEREKKLMRKIDFRLLPILVRPPPSPHARLTTSTNHSP